MHETIIRDPGVFVEVLVVLLFHKIIIILIKPIKSSAVISAIWHNASVWHFKMFKFKMF